MISFNFELIFSLITLKNKNGFNRLSLNDKLGNFISITGFPQPSISWSKNGQELKTKDGMTITYAHNHVRLELKKVNVKDAGRYTCTASNEVGSASSTADLVVKSIQFYDYVLSIERNLIKEF